MNPSPHIRLVLFDALHTLIKPRSPIARVYIRAFAPYLGDNAALKEEDVKRSFKLALKENQDKDPLLSSTSPAETQRWWTRIIRQTVVSAGGKPYLVDEALPTVVPRLMEYFSSNGGGYVLFDDVLPTLSKFKESGLRLGVVSNADSRIRPVLDSLEVTRLLTNTSKGVILSAEEGVSKPSPEIFHRAMQKLQTGLGPAENFTVANALHVGDSLNGDYNGARSAGLHALLLRRPGEDYEGQGEENLNGANVISSLAEILHHPGVSSQVAR